MAYTFTRQALYDLVWQKPRQQLAKQLGMSDVWLAKACRAADIPMPPRGYWAGKLPASRRQSWPFRPGHWASPTA